MNNTMDITTQKALEQIQEKFADGHHVVEVMTEKPDRLRRNLYKAARRRKLPWRFALTPKGVAIAR